MMQVINTKQFSQLVGDGQTVIIGGSGSGHAVPDALMKAIQERYLAEAHPRNITSIHPVGLGDKGELGANHFAHEGLLKRIVCGTLSDAPSVAALAAQDLVEAYTLPQGVLSQLTREIAGGRPGLITHVGLHTFVDPRLEGGRQSCKDSESLVEVLELDGREWLYYRAFHIDVALLRGTTADEDGNISMEDEAIWGEMLSMAQATKKCGGKVIVQVKQIAKAGTLAARTVKIPGILVDYVVVVPDQMQTFQTKYNPSYAGALKVSTSGFPRLALDARKIVARRCAMEIAPGLICNIGSGICTGVGLVAAEEGVLDKFTLTNEQGLIGGAPAFGLDAGAAWNYDAIVDQPYQFDFYDGGGLDLAFLSFVEIDRTGNVNISRFKDRIIGIGGFVNISQNTKSMVFAGTFTAGGLEISAAGGELRIENEGRFRRFVETVEQLTYNAQYGLSRQQEVTYITERAVFRATPAGLELVEYAPGINIERDILAHMDFQPLISKELKEMDSRMFVDKPMGLKQSFLDIKAMVN